MFRPITDHHQVSSLQFCKSIYTISIIAYWCWDLITCCFNLGFAISVVRENLKHVA
jgi:hypothetical protein